MTRVGTSGGRIGLRTG